MTITIRDSQRFDVEQLVAYAEANGIGTLTKGAVVRQALSIGLYRLNNGLDKLVGPDAPEVEEPNLDGSTTAEIEPGAVDAA